jgi:hypothetical protein
MNQFKKNIVGVWRRERVLLSCVNLGYIAFEIVIRQKKHPLLNILQVATSDQNHFMYCVFLNLVLITYLLSFQTEVIFLINCLDFSL